MNRKNYRIKSTETIDDDKSFTFDTYLSDYYATYEDAVEALKSIWERFRVCSNPNFVVNVDSIEFNIKHAGYVGNIQYTGDELLFKVALGAFEYSKAIYIEEVLAA